KLYNEALERAHGKPSGDDAQAPEEVAEEISDRIALPPMQSQPAMPAGVMLHGARPIEPARSVARGSTQDLGALIAEEAAAAHSREAGALFLPEASAPPRLEAKGTGPRVEPVPPARPRRRRWPWVVTGVAILLGGAGAAAAFVMVRADRQA